MERGISPEEAQANNSSPPQSSIPESGPMLVRDLASFVARLADGIERFPPRLREIQEFMEADRPLQSRSSDEYSRARSLIQNAMDAIRNLSHLTQMVKPNSSTGHLGYQVKLWNKSPIQLIG